MCVCVGGGRGITVCVLTCGDRVGAYVGVLGVGVLQYVYLLVETGEAGSFLRISSKITNSTRGMNTSNSSTN